MDGTQPSTSKADYTDISKKLNEMSIDGVPLTPVVSITNFAALAGSDYTATIIHIPENAGSPTFDQGLMKKFMDFMWNESESDYTYKRKRDDSHSNNMVNNNNWSKLIKPNIPKKYESQYKNAHNASARVEIFAIVDSNLKRYR